jgi:hypothetical protein
MLTELPADQREAAGAWVKDRLTDEAWLADARKYLTAQAYPTEVVAKYPPMQVLVFKLISQGRAYRDEGMKWLNVPYWQAELGLAEVSKPAAEMEERLSRAMVSSIPKVLAAHVRVAQRFDLLRAVEAIRLEAAKNGGKLPASLTDLSVPVPPDPAAGKPFDYKVDGLTATLAGKPTPLSDSGTMQYRYELRLRK